MPCWFISHFVQLGQQWSHDHMTTKKHQSNIKNLNHQRYQLVRLAKVKARFLHSSKYIKKIKGKIQILKYQF